MRLVVIAIGRLKQGPERELAERYRKRFDDIGRKLGFRAIEIVEIPESRARDAATRIAEEAAAISAATPEKSVLVTLDERGENIDSAAFSRHLERWRDRSVSGTIFVIGGADGLSPDLRRNGKLAIAFGAATWPHQMVRIMLLGHPYHRA
jgi:23S rRNA (pseudouridine1915-N3)-methyltransferase